MRESRTYGSGRGACHEMHVPTATEAARVHIAFTATFVSLAAIAGGAVIVLTGVVGFGCYRFLRDLFGKPPRQLDV